MSDFTTTTKAAKPLDKYKGRVADVASIYDVAKDIWTTGKSTYQAYQQRKWFYVTVASDDPFYESVLEWVTKQIPAQKQKNIAARSSLDPWYVRGIDSNPGETPTATLDFNYADKSTKTIEIQGHKISVTIAEDNPEKQEKKPGVRREADKLQFTCKSQAAQIVLREELLKILRSRKEFKRRPKIWTPTSYGDWQSRDGLSLRHPDSVKLHGDTMDMLLEDVSHFLTREDFYLRRGMPYHRGYLFHGPPGTGKTSAAKAIAAYHNLDLYYMSLGDANRDVDLMEFMSSVKSRSVLLLEDVDVFQAAQQRSSEGDEDSKGISLAGLLNALDGVATPHGLIAILTSNQPDVLDQALVRPGRIDRSVEFGSLTDDSLNALFEFFYETRPSHRLSAANVGMPADAMEIFKRHMDDPQAAEAYIRGLKYNERTNGFRSFHLGANEESGGESGFHGIRDYDGSGPGHGIYSSGSHLGW